MRKGKYWNLNNNIGYYGNTIFNVILRTNELLIVSKFLCKREYVVVNLLLVSIQQIRNLFYVIKKKL